MKLMLKLLAFGARVIPILRPVWQFVASRKVLLAGLTLVLTACTVLWNLKKTHDLNVKSKRLDTIITTLTRETQEANKRLAREIRRVELVNKQHRQSLNDMQTLIEELGNAQVLTEREVKLINDAISAKVK